MDILTILILVACCTGASFVQRVSGFGFGIFIMTMLPYLMPSYGEATALSGILSACQSLLVVASTWRQVAWRRLWPILLSFLVVSFFSVELVTMVDDVKWKHYLGILLIILSIYFLFGSERIKIKPTLPMQISMGGLSGVLGGLFAMQGPPAVLYFVTSERDKDSYLAITQAYFFVGNVFMTLYRARNGLVTPIVGISWLYALVGVFIGTALGRMVFNRVSAPTLRRIVYVYMAISGVVALLAV